MQHFKLSLILLVCLAFSNLVHANALDWQLKNQQGELISASQYLGKPVVLHFWATWCPYCKKIQPALQSMKDQSKEDDLIVLGVSFREDLGTKPQDVLNARGHDFMTLVDGEQLAADFSVRGTPTTFFIDRKGQVVAKITSSNPNNKKLSEALAVILQK